MPTTSNFGWTTPADTDLVKDGALAIRTLGNGIDTSFLDLKGGTTGQILSKASNTDLDYTWINNDQGDITEVQAGTGISVASGTGPIPVVTNTVATAFDAKGDLIGGTGADTFTRLAVGANNTVLTADSTTATGLKWAAPASPSFVGCCVKRYNVSTVLGANTAYTVSFTTEEYDTDGFHDNTTNNSRITIPTGKGGKYLFTGYVANALGTPGSYFELDILKNGGQYTDSGLREGRVIRNAPKEYLAMAQVVNAAAGDYFELSYQQQNGETVNMFFSAQFVYLGA